MNYCSLALVVLVLLSGCGGGSSKRTKYLQGVIADQAKYDQISRGQEIDGEKSGEAKNWLEFTNTQNVLPATSRKQTVAYVNSYYDAGASRVMCIYVTKQATFLASMCTSLLIELPTDAQKRQEVFKAHARIEKEFWGKKYSKVEDEGQKYLHLNMDP